MSAMLRSDPLFDELSDGVCVSDKDGTMLYMNPAAERLLAARRGAAPASSCELICGHLYRAESKESCSACCPLRAPGDGPEAVSFQGRYGPLSARMAWVGDQVRRLEDWGNLRVRCLRIHGPLWGMPAEERHLIFIEDASAEAELARRKEEWRSMLAHDLRSPLANTLAAMRQLEDLPPGTALGDAERELLAIAARACLKVSALVESFLELSKLEDVRSPVEVRTLRLKPLAERAAREQAARARAKGVSIRVDVADGLELRGEEGLLERVLQNLLDNAIKFARWEGAVAISAAGPDESGQVAVSVKDDGPGIPAEELPLLFDRFARRGRRAAGAGHGLGLAFCRLALQRMGGTIEARSSPGAGTEMLLRLPGASP